MIKGKKHYILKTSRLSYISILYIYIYVVISKLIYYIYIIYKHAQNSMYCVDISKIVNIDFFITQSIQVVEAWKFGMKW